MSGSTPLTQRLVELGAQAIEKRNKRPWKHSDDVQYRLEARDVIAAVLRELAQHSERPGAWSLSPTFLAVLAESVEGGE